MKKRYLIFHFFFLFFFLLSFSSLLMAQAPTYIGSESCLTCHNGVIASDKSSWRNTLHANGYSEVLNDRNSMVLEKGIVNDANQNGIDDFKDGLDLATTPNFSQFGANAPKLAYDSTNGYTITIGNEVMRVYMTYGGSGMWKQRYAVKIVTTSGESADFYISPVQYNEKTKEYVQYDPDYWYDSSDQPIYDPATSTLADAANGKSFGKGCVGCHVTGLSVLQDANGEWIANSSHQYNADDAAVKGNPSYFDLNGDGQLDEINTGCETCHGPGSQHNGNPANIINPERDMTVDQINNLCGMCHSRGHSQPNGTFGYSFDDQNLLRWTPQDILDGKGVADYHSEGAGLWGDGVTSKQHHQQFEDIYKSDMPTNPYDKTSCITCHDAHGSSREHQIVEEREEEGIDGNPLVITTNVDDNTLCLSCHATFGDFAGVSKEMVANVTNPDSLAAIAAVVTQHTHHPYDPEGDGTSRCTNCHMQKSAKSAIKYDIHSHTFLPVAPQKTKDFAMPNSCAVSCHAKTSYPNFGIAMTDADFTDWGGANQQAMADTLIHYFGPEGIWFKTTPVSVRLTDLTTPKNYQLSQNYPNPFNPTTMIRFSIPKSSNVRIVIYNSVGQKVDELINTQKNAGNYFVDWDASQFASGIYIYRMEAGNFVQVKKMMLMK